VAVGRLQNEYDTLKDKCQLTENQLSFVSQLQMNIENAIKQDPDEKEQDASMFMTRISDENSNPLKQQNSGLNQSFLPSLRIEKDRSFISNGEQSHKSIGRNANRIFKTAHSTSKRSASHISPCAGSGYAKGMIPTENLKFSQFLDIIHNSKLTADEMKQETRDYVQILETSYTDKIRELQVELQQARKTIQKVKNKQSSESVHKSELETLFVDCIEQVRKEIIKRRLHAEV